MIRLGRFNHPSWFSRIFKDTPSISAVTAPCTFELGDRFQECLAILGPDVIFDRHAAAEAHTATDHFQKYKAATEGMTTKREAKSYSSVAMDMKGM